MGFTGLRQREFVDIPPNSVAHTEGFTVLKENTLITNFQPHMHLRGKAQALEAILPAGQTVILSHVDNFNFNWHNSYIYADDVAPLLPKGTVLKATSWHDNTAANKANPDPTVGVGYGERTVDEMNHTGSASPTWTKPTISPRSMPVAPGSRRNNSSSNVRRVRVSKEMREMKLRRTRCLAVTAVVAAGRP